jgi:hypothetical protein
MNNLSFHGSGNNDIAFDILLILVIPLVIDQFKHTLGVAGNADDGGHKRGLALSKHACLLGRRTEGRLIQVCVLFERGRGGVVLQFFSIWLGRGRGLGVDV